MKNIFRGIECEFEGSPHFNIERVLNGIPLECHQIFLQWGMIHDKDGQINYPEIISSDFIHAISDNFNYCIWELLLHIFPKEETPKSLRNYKDFSESSCECSILYYDAGYLAIYVKNKEWLDTLGKNIIEMVPQRVDIITDQNDTRTSFL